MTFLQKVNLFWSKREMEMREKIDGENLQLTIHLCLCSSKSELAWSNKRINHVRKNKLVNMIREREEKQKIDSRINRAKKHTVLSFTTRKHSSYYTIQRTIVCRINLSHSQQQKPLKILLSLHNNYQRVKLYGEKGKKWLIPQWRFAS